MSYQKHLETIKTINDQFRYYKTIESMFELDQWSALPAEGGAYRQQVAAHVGVQKAGLFDTEEAKAAVDEAFVALWDAGVKTGKDTYIVVSPWFYSLFKNSLTEILTNNVEMVERGIFGMYNGAYVKMSNNVATADDADCLAVMTKDAIAYADGIEEVEAYRPQDSFSDAVKVLHTYGAKVVRPEQLVCIKATKGG